MSCHRPGKVRHIFWKVSDDLLGKQFQANCMPDTNVKIGIPRLFLVTIPDRPLLPVRLAFRAPWRQPMAALPGDRNPEGVPVPTAYALPFGARAVHSIYGLALGPGLDC